MDQASGPQAATLGRLWTIKAAVDPENVFHQNFPVAVP
ncbi:BBE domain-containing protein [Micromonospora mirobrigensis]